ncbi:hypothetical protein NMG60_11009443 [Bertholletia excelsa]
MSNRCKKQAVDKGTNDVISSLPRDIIDSILERLPIRDVARTSILSRKWRYIWSRQPNLVLEKHFFEAHLRNKPHEFMNTVNRLLLLHDGPIRKFSLYIPNIHCSWNLYTDQWLLFLSRNGIKELILDNRYLNPYKLPSCVFSSPELATLKIRYCIFKAPHDFSGFPSLVNLRFEKITFGTNVFGPHIPTIPLLETLEFTSCNGIENFHIHGPKLQSLFAADSHNVKSIPFQGFPNLTVLSVSLRKAPEDWEQGRMLNLSTFLGQFPRIVNLSLDRFFLKLLVTDPGPERLSIVFHHLTYLVLDKLRFDDLGQMQCLLCLLRSSPNLRDVSIKAFPVLHNTTTPELSFLEAPNCTVGILNQLRTVKVSWINGLRAELLFIKCILACSPLLEKMYVQCNAKVEATMALQIATELMRFIRASSRAEIIYLRSKVV